MGQKLYMLKTYCLSDYLKIHNSGVYFFVSLYKFSIKMAWVIFPITFLCVKHLFWCYVLLITDIYIEHINWFLNLGFTNKIHQNKKLSQSTYFELCGISYWYIFFTLVQKSLLKHISNIQIPSTSHKF